MKTISERFYQGKQSWYYERLVIVGAFRLRVTIRRDSYDEQSHLHGYVLDPVHYTWNRLVTRPIEGAACFGANYTRADTPKAPFAADANSVLDELLRLLPL